MKLWPQRRPIVPLVRLTGPIGLASTIRSGLSMSAIAPALERAFTMSNTPAVAFAINSPGGSAVQSHLIYKRIRALAAEHDKRVLVFCEDVAASGGYFLAVAGDEIYADPSSIVGSIGVISASFGLEKLIERVGITRRVYTAGDNKGSLDPFLPERADDIERLKAIQQDVHATFIAIVKERRGARLKNENGDLFSGAFWSGPKAVELGLIDGLSDPHTRVRDLYGERARLAVVPLGRPGLLGRLRRFPSIGGVRPRRESDGFAFSPALVDDALAALEARALWARFGL
jgi:signal peptide peptidase SppA